MMQNTIYLESPDLKKLSKISQAFPNETRKAMVASLNRAGITVRALMAREASAHYHIKVGAVKKTIRMKRASMSRLEAVNTSQDRRMKMSAFPYKVQNRNTVRTPVSVKIKRGAGGVPNVNPPIFYGKGELYRRRSVSDSSLRLGMTVSIPQMISNDEVYEKIQREGNAMLQKRLEHELEYRLGESYSSLLD